MTQHIVVLGAGYAGLGTAKRVARRMRGTDTHVTLVNASDRFVERIRLHQLATGQRLADHRLADLLAGTGVELVTASVTGIDPQERRVRMDRAPDELGYDTLIYALGSRPDDGTVPGAAEHAHSVADISGARGLRSRLATLSDGTVAVVGGALTGLETAAEVAEARPDLCTLLVTSGSPGGWLSLPARRHLRRVLGRLGVQIHGDALVTEVADAKLTLADGSHIAADVTAWAAGFRAPDLAANAGLDVDSQGRLVIDATLRSVSHPEIYGVGDAAALPTPDGHTARMSCQIGVPAGAYAGDVVADRLTGREPRPARPRYYGQNISLGRHDGLVQFTRRDDSPVNVVLTGRAAARTKEAVVRSTVSVLRNPTPYHRVLRYAAGG